MSHERQMLVEAVEGVIGRHATSPGEWEGLHEIPFDQQLWTALAEHGFTLVSAPEELGGFGAEMADAAAVLEVAGAAAVAAPLAETVMVGSWALAEAGLELPDGPITAVADGVDLELRRDGRGWHLEGRLRNVPWGDVATCVVVVGSDSGELRLLALPPGSARVEPRSNLAGEPRPCLDFALDLDDDAVFAAPPGLDAAALRRRGALARALMMVGALRRARELTIEYVGQRQQFGRSISSFQAVQQQLAELVAEVAAAEAAMAAAVEAEAGGPAPNAVAVAKFRVGQAASIVATIAHQLHGAIGITDEYDLHLSTRRLWAWRDEFGSETAWAIELGRNVLGDPAPPSLSSLASLTGR